jgi:hypothetical protein
VIRFDGEARGDFVRVELYVGSDEVDSANFLLDPEEWDALVAGVAHPQVRFQGQPITRQVSIDQALAAALERAAKLEAELKTARRLRSVAVRMGRWLAASGFPYDWTVADSDAGANDIPVEVLAECMRVHCASDKTVTLDDWVMGAAEEAGWDKSTTDAILHILRPG